MTPTPSVLPATVLLAARRYSSLVDRYNDALKANLDEYGRTFRFLASLRHAFGS
jgi:hypothetical protein